MKRTSLHSSEPTSARKKTAAAKANKPFMTALLDRDDRGHEDAVDRWSRLHEAAFPGIGRKAGHEGGPNGSARLRATLRSAGSGRTQGRIELADSGIDDWEADREREVVGDRGHDATVGPPSAAVAGQAPMPSSPGSRSGVWVVDMSAPDSRDFVLVNPITDRPVTDGQGNRVTTPPEAFEQTVPPAVQTNQDALLNIWHVDDLDDAVAVGARSGIVYGIMLDMLRIRSMTRAQQRDLFRRIAEMPERFGRDWYVVAGHLRGASQRAIAEPFWYPAILTDEELEAHLSLSRTTEDIGETGATSIWGLALTRLSGMAGAVAGNVGGALGVIGEHYESRANAYEREIERRRDSSAWPPAPAE